MKVWAKTDEFSEGKFLVVRRDGTVPDWPHFVMGAADPATPFGLIGYARAAQKLKLDPDYVSSVGELAEDFLHYQNKHEIGDPDAPPHRQDLPLAIGMMRREFNVADIAATLERIDSHASEGKTLRIQALVQSLLAGRKPEL